MQHDYIEEEFIFYVSVDFDGVKIEMLKPKEVREKGILFRQIVSGYESDFVKYKKIGVENASVKWVDETVYKVDAIIGISYFKSSLDAILSKAGKVLFDKGLDEQYFNLTGYTIKETKKHLKKYKKSRKKQNAKVS